MNITTAIGKVSLWLVAVMLLARLTAVTALAAAPTLQGQVTLRPLTPQNIVDYGLGDAQRASGLSTIGVGQPAYLEVLVNNAVPDADITNVTWVLTDKPIGSSAALAPSPLGANVPTFKMADRFNQAFAPVFKVGGRTLLRPDVRGQYTVTASIQTASSGNTNLTQNITAGNYVGVNTCALCHSGGLVAPNTFVPWLGTLHATAFTRAIDGHASPDFSEDSLPFHTVGYDANTNAVNAGFDDIAKQLGWLFPTTLNTNNWDAVPPRLKNLANIQCENCHGPGSEHAFSLGDTNLISRSFIAGNCAQCHDNKNETSPNKIGIKFAEWNSSLHSHTTRTPSGPGRENCVRCHTAAGFRNFTEFAGSNTPYATNTVYEPITCAACHDPHDATNPHQLRAANKYTLPEGTTVTNVGSGALCMTCHHSRNGEATQNVANYKLGKPTWAGGSSFGPHDSTAGDMVEGVNAITYGKVIPSGSHSAVIPNVCVGCHMQPVAPTHPAYTKAGGHTYSMTYDVVNGGVTNSVDLVDVCIKCHGPIKDFNFARKDYDGDGVIDGVQTEIQHLLNNLSRMLPSSTYRADGNYIADGLVKSSISVKTNWQTRFLQAAWNFQFVSVEGSRGVHNAPYAVGVLKASIADLTGDSNNDALSDSWQIQFFGSATNPNAAPNAAPAGDGIPNWLKFSLGLDPTKPGISVPGGVIWVNGEKLSNSPDNTLAIYTAAEVVFDTVVGTSYQIQGISTLGGGWQNIGSPIAGTGSSISYVTPTRNDLQQFFRVTHTP
ncbi:MAG: hypothetical protein JWM99_2610 [Verrucomicrobiales bacterium]|nr:hypothetical protein [Verrucomicrobiales bacterium]